MDNNGQSQATEALSKEGELVPLQEAVNLTSRICLNILIMKGTHTQTENVTTAIER